MKKSALISCISLLFAVIASRVICGNWMCRSFGGPSAARKIIPGGSLRGRASAARFARPDETLSIDANYA